MELFLALALLVLFVSCRGIAETSDSPRLFEWYKEIDGAAALPNAYYVEESCVYWAGLIRILPDSPGPYCIKGQYPKARFFSIGTYHADIPVDVVYDFQIMPDQGSWNPFSDKRRYPADGRDLFYTLTLIEVPRVEDIPRLKPANVLYVTRQKGQNNDYYLFLYRVYWDGIAEDAWIPDGYTRRQWEKQGQKPLPDVVTSSSGGAGKRPGDPAIRPELTDAEYSPIVERYRKSCEEGASPVEAVPRSKDCCWVVGNPKIGFGNSAAVYLMASFDDSGGEVAVCRFKTPTFSNTNAGEIIDPSSRQTRYWSVCTHIPGTMTTIACLSDRDFVTDDEGYATLVLSASEHRPANARNWLPYAWNDAFQRYGALVFLRHLLPSPSLFPESPYFFAEVCSRLHSPASPGYLNCLENGVALACFAGAYYPQSYYCSRREFEFEGPRWKSKA